MQLQEYQHSTKNFKSDKIKSNKNFPMKNKLGRRDEFNLVLKFKFNLFLLSVDQKMIQFSSTPISKL